MLSHFGASLIAQLIKESACNAGDSGSIPGSGESACNAGDPGLIPESGISAGEGADYPLQCSRASLVVQLVKNSPALWETWVQPWVRKIPWRRAWQSTPVFLPGEFHGQRSLAGCSP